MNEAKYVEFLPEHLWDFDDVEGRLINGNVKREGEIHKKAGPSCSIEYDGRIILCGGIHRYWEGTGEAWVAIRKGCAGPASLLMARKWLLAAAQANKFHRLQAFTKLAPVYSRTMRFFGFHHEATCIAYGPNGETKELWARLFE